MWLTDLKIVLPERIIERGAVNIEDRKIAQIVEGDMRGRGLSAVGLTLIPGVIDFHGDMLERDIEPRPNAYFPVEMALYELDKRLAATGITTAYAAVSFAWHSSDIRGQEVATDIIRTIAAKRDSTLVDFRIHTRFEITNPDTAPILEGLLAENLVDVVSLMDHTPGQGQYANLERYVDFMVKWMGIPREYLENDAKERMTKNMAEVSDTPRDWDIAAEVCRIAREHQIPLASHDDDTPEKINKMHELGVTISEFPVTLTAATYARELGMHTVMGAPNAYRGSSNTGNLSAMDAVKAGLVDILATDYYPAAPLQAAFKLAREGVLPLNESIKLVSQNVASALGLADRGRIAEGLSADLVLVEEGLHPRVRATLRNGEPIYWDAHMAQAFAASTTGNGMKYFEHYASPDYAPALGNKTLGLEPVFHEGVLVYKSQLGAWTELGANTQLVESSMDDYSYTAGDNQIIYTQIGKFSNIASHVRINPGNHPMERVTLHHITYRRKMYGLGEQDDTDFFEWRRSHQCVIGHDTWLGHNVVVMPGVTVGTGSVVGSGAVVTKDVAPYTIVAGVPAKPIRMRFSETIAEKLLQIAWWDWDRATLEARFDDLMNVEPFVEKYGST